MNPFVTPARGDVMSRMLLREPSRRPARTFLIANWASGVGKTRASLRRWHSRTNRL